MAWHDDLLAELPAPYSEEPFSLRQDIADELRDHLECAARRETLKDPDPSVVEDRVLARFGNPRKIAQRLWLDAMKEILMTQKLTLALVSIVAVASLAACGLMWSLARDFQAVAAEAQDASARLLSQGQEANANLLKQNQEMMQQLAALANRKEEPGAALDWIPLKIEVVKADGTKTPAKGFNVGIRGKALSESEEMSLSETTKDDGIADFGVVRPGYYYVDIDAPWGEKTGRNIFVKPGVPHVEKIESPAAPPQEIEVKPVVVWPKELEGQDLAALVQIVRIDQTKVGKNNWHGGERHLLIRPDGRIAVYPATYQSQRGSADQSYFGGGPLRDGTLELETVTFLAPSEVDRSTFRMQGNEMALMSLKLVKLSPDAGFPGEHETATCIAPSMMMDNYMRVVGSSSRNNSSTSEPLATYKAEGEGIQEWQIEIPGTTVTSASAILTTEQFPNLPSGSVAMGAWTFVGLDKDGNKELSEKEFEESSRALAQYVKEFPVTLPQFIEAFVQYRQARGGRFGSGGQSGSFGRQGGE